MDQLIQQRLAAAGITNPATLDMLKNSLT
jgi:hypothetical protein